MVVELKRNEKNLASPRPLKFKKKLEGGGGEMVVC